MDRLNELWPELWKSALETLYMTSFALVLGGILGLAIGVILYVTRPGGLIENRAVAVWSPELDRSGNSLIGTRLLELFVQITGTGVL